jgi:hypothetical protein
MYKTPMDRIRAIKAGESFVPHSIEELRKLGEIEGWTETKFQNMRRLMFPTPEEHEKAVNAFYTIFDPYLPI